MPLQVEAICCVRQSKNMPFIAHTSTSERMHALPLPLPVTLPFPTPPPLPFLPPHLSSLSLNICIPLLHEPQSWWTSKKGLNCLFTLIYSALSKYMHSFIAWTSGLVDVEEKPGALFFFFQSRTGILASESTRRKGREVWQHIYGSSMRTHI